MKEEEFFMDLDPSLRTGVIFATVHAMKEIIYEYSKKVARACLEVCEEGRISTVKHKYGVDSISDTLDGGKLFFQVDHYVPLSEFFIRVYAKLVERGVHIESKQFVDELYDYIQDYLENTSVSYENVDFMIFPTTASVIFYTRKQVRSSTP